MTLHWDAADIHLLILKKRNICKMIVIQLGEKYSVGLSFPFIISCKQKP